MKNIYERLRDLREDSDLKQKEVAEILNLQPNTVSQYESGKREPDFTVLNRMSTLFKVSLDYLFGRTDVKYDPTEAEFIEITKIYCEMTTEQKKRFVHDMKEWR